MVFTGSLAVVDQDVILFEDSITENIRIWDKSIEDFEIIMAARDAQIHEDIMSREGGYGVIVRENGKNFSGGQCQRLEIARVLAQDPTIVILDEATSALDARTEFEVIHSIRESPASSWRTGFPPFVTVTKLSYWKMAVWWSAAHMRNCMPKAAPIRA